MLLPGTPLRGNRKNTPSLLLAPMAGVTHSAFRRLCADFGGYSALTTEMLSTKSLAAENLALSPFTRRREEEGAVIYQLVTTSDEHLEQTITRLATINPFAIDINLGCPAPLIKRTGGGKALFDDLNRLRAVLGRIRDRWHGPLTVKCRLGNPGERWEELFLERLALFAEIGINALCLHPRFSDEKLKRHARWDRFAWVKKHSTLPLIGNGDICNTKALELLGDGSCDALMIGRAAAVRPWIFRLLQGDAVVIDYEEVWSRHLAYIREDFPPEKAIGRIKEFSFYYAQNFFFGHEFYRLIHTAPNLTTAAERAHRFLTAEPQISAES